MTGCVLDASALLALLLSETRANRVKAALDGSLMSVVNMAEVVSHYANAGRGRHVRWPPWAGPRKPVC